jgi:hypothetical protein
LSKETIGFGIYYFTKVRSIYVAIVEGYEDYRSYRPLSANCVVFNVEAVKRSRPQTAESTRTLASTPETYILGNPTKSRPVSAATVRLLRPVKQDTPIDKLIEKPFIYSSVQEKEVNIQEGYSSNYPPSRFPFLNPKDPLAVYDGALLEQVRPTSAGNELKKAKHRPSSSRPGTRPPSGRMYMWDIRQ